MRLNIFGFLKKGKKNPDENIKPVPLPVDPSKAKVAVNPVSSSYEHSEGHVDFKNTKSITRSIKRAALRESFEKRKETFYDGDKLYGD